MGGLRAEAALKSLSRGFYATSVGLSALAGASNINGNPAFEAGISVDVCANVLLLPGLRLSVGTAAAVGIGSQGVSFLPGFTFALKEGTRDEAKPIISLPEGGVRVGHRQTARFFFSTRMGSDMIYS